MDSQLIMMALILPTLFGVSLLGEGIYRVMAYDNQGWVGVGIGGTFIVVVIFAYLFVLSKGLA